MLTPKRLAVVFVFFCLIQAPGGAVASSGKDSPAAEVNHESASGRGEGNVLRFAVHVSKMGKMDPHFAAGSQDRTLADLVFNGLLRYVPGNAPAIEPDLAAEMPIPRTSDGRQIWTVKLRKGVMFHPTPVTPSYELTADDVIFSFTKAAAAKTSAYAGDYDGIRVKKLDD
ncbi:MAG: ABC transporter substrate-binding protein, partial [Desulfobacterales bacterium]|nr:ABC transporter substrate-binding protein [Desulfobacterales bacterium]